MANPAAPVVKQVVTAMTTAGHAPKDIAAALGISEQQVHDHLKPKPTAADYVAANVHPAYIGTVQQNPGSVAVGKIVNDMYIAGHDKKQIADALGISEAHVEDHINPPVVPKLELLSEAHYGKLGKL
jgi:DNA-binding CsgD family transcriptional regulator